MYCRQCGKEINDDSIFCEYCGTKIVDTQSMKNQKNKSNKKLPLIAVISSVAVILIICIVIGITHSSDKNNDSKSIVKEENTSNEIDDNTETTDMSLLDNQNTDSSDMSDDNLEKGDSQYRVDPNTPYEIAAYAYERYLRDNEEYDYRCRLIYVDDDDMPELVVYGNGTRLLTYKDNNVVELLYTSSLMFQYIERTGFYRYHGALSNDIIEKLDNGNTEITAYFTRTPIEGELNEDIEYYIGSFENSKPVSEDEYYNYVDGLGVFNNVDDSPLFDSVYMALDDLTMNIEEIDDSNSERWKQAYYNFYFPDEDMIMEEDNPDYKIIDVNKDGIPEIFVSAFEYNKIYTLDKDYNVVEFISTYTDLDYADLINYTEGGSMLLHNGGLQQIGTCYAEEYIYSNDEKIWVLNNRLDINVEFDMNIRGYDDEEFCDYYVNGQEYSTYNEAIQAFNPEYSIDMMYNLYYDDSLLTYYDQESLKRAIMDYGRDTYYIYAFQVTRFEFVDGILYLEADDAGKIYDNLDTLSLAYPLAKDCKWYDITGYSINGLTTYEKMIDVQKEWRSLYDSCEKGEESEVLESPSAFSIKVKDGIIVEVGLGHS